MCSSGGGNYDSSISQRAKVHIPKFNIRFQHLAYRQNIYRSCLYNIQVFIKVHESVYVRLIYDPITWHKSMFHFTGKINIAKLTLQKLKIVKSYVHLLRKLIMGSYNTLLMI